MHLTLRKQSQQIHEARFMMGCFVEVQLPSEVLESDPDAVNEAFKEIKRVERKYSRFKKESELTRVNAIASEKPVKIDAEFFALLQRCKEYFGVSQRFVDVTATPLTDLWEHAARRGELPSLQSIEATRERVGFDKVELSSKNSSVYFCVPGMKLDLGCVGKGYALDRAAELLKNRGVRQYLVSAGSTVLAGSETVSMGVPAANGSLLRVSLNNNAVSTSSQSERYFHIQGKDYGHIVNPATGTPVPSRSYSLSVAAPTAMDSDVLSTASYLLGPESSCALLSRYDATLYF